MKPLHATLLCLMIAYGQASYGQSAPDSIICFTYEQAREINERVTLYPILLDEIENLMKLESKQEKQINILITQNDRMQIEVEELTAKLNNCEAEAQQLRRKRIWWGVVGVAVGAAGYSLLK